MPGRPRTMAKKISKIEEQVTAAAAELFVVEPRQYRESRQSEDPLGRAWNAAVDATMLASIKLEELGDLLRKKAGITEPGPAAKILADDAAVAPDSVTDTT